MEEGGVRAVEQLIFSKMMLFSFVYHHQKILASDAVIINMLEELLLNGGNGHIKVEHYLDFLNYTDYDILSTAAEGPSDRFKLLRDRILTRDLPKRCFSMNREFIKDIGGDEIVGKAWVKLQKDALTSEGRRKLRERIINKIFEISSKKISEDKIFINIPKLPKLEESIKAPIEMANGEIKGMGDFQQIEGWQKTYDKKKFRGYFFGDEDVRGEASSAIQVVLQEDYNLVFDERAITEAKIHS
ncbi:hypothetical protein AAU61_15015 [Desulfocarbo indianensis]|nr:hypothetical protein AAU61_15015 [Desulfocarbo indianensis]